MTNQKIYAGINVKMHLKVFKNLLLTGLAVGTASDVFIHLIFFDIPLEFKPEMQILWGIFIIAIAFASAISTVLLLADIIDLLIKQRKKIVIPVFHKMLFALIFVLLIVVAGCNAQASVGVKKDITTGLTASYKNMVPKKVMLVMNDEVLGHTDIPIGEKFYIVNDKIKGLVEKNGKVSVGCSLLMTDKKGKVILKEEDLFKGNDVFEINDITYLRCGVNTGSPMKWEQKYDVKVIFWDKYGKGKIENKVTIRIIDIP